ncbi:hypothetical protein [Nocardia sp. CNY236]|nr:hypothetical protein [Nocardia sp. CNY236]
MGSEQTPRETDSTETSGPARSAEQQHWATGTLLGHLILHSATWHRPQ